MGQAGPAGLLNAYVSCQPDLAAQLSHLICELLLCGRLLRAQQVPVRTQDCVAAAGLHNGEVNYNSQYFITPDMASAWLSRHICSAQAGAQQSFLST